MTEIVSRELCALECVPSDLSFLDTYQQNAWGQIVRDDSGHTIGGKQPIDYFYDGLVEEYAETYGTDRVNQDYSRLGVLTLLPNLFNPDTATQPAVTRHTKELGDVSWYLANFLSTQSLSLRHAAVVGKLAWQLDTAATPVEHATQAAVVERQYPWAKYAVYFHETERAARQLTEAVHIDNLTSRKNLLIAAGKLVVSMMHLAEARFNTPFAEILGQNKAKINKRIADGTVFDKSGGDDR